jgi:RNA polymerase sigma factor (sigma-70 family)
MYRTEDGVPDPHEFESAFRSLFESDFARLFRYLDRLGGDPDLASDLAQEAFVRLYRRGSLPDSPAAWLATVGTNLFRNHMRKRTRRRRLLTVSRGAFAHSDPAPSPASAPEASETARCVRRALDQLPERDRQLLLLRSQGYSYHELAEVLGLHEASVGTLLSRARTALGRHLGHAT